MKIATYNDYMTFEQQVIDALSKKYHDKADFNYGVAFHHHTTPILAIIEVDFGKALAYWDPEKDRWRPILPYYRNPFRMKPPWINSYDMSKFSEIIRAIKIIHNWSDEIVLIPLKSFRRAVDIEVTDYIDIDDVEKLL